jgi:hypothetical protein
MWAKLSYRQKFRLLGVAAVLLLVICYQLSFSKTIQEYRAYQDYRQAEALLQAGNPAGSALEEKEKKLSSLLDQYILDTLDNSRNLLGIVSRYCESHDLLLKEYKPAPFIATDTLGILTRPLTVEGRFIDCLQLIHALETNYKAGKVCSVLFKSTVAANTGQTTLSCTLYIQNLIMNRHDD